MEKNIAKYWINKAYKEKWALGMFNAHHLESFQAISDAANKTLSPLMISTTMGGLKHVGLDYFIKMSEVAKKNSSVPIIIHLDHGANYKIIKNCIDLGFDSVMIDASYKKYDENVLIVKKVVEYAHKHNVCVEAQIGRTSPVEAEELEEKKTVVKEAIKFVNDTKVDYLAVSIGSRPGKINLEPNIDIFLLSQISNAVKIPLVLHGGSGIPEKILKESIKNGISKINIDAAIKNSFREAFIKNYRKINPIIDTRISLKEAKNNAEIIVEKLLKIFGSINKAK